MCVIDLALKTALRPATRLVFGVKINTAIRTRLGHDVDAECEIFERRGVADIKQMTTFAMRDQRAVFDGEVVLIFVGHLPAVVSLAIKQGSETRFYVGGG